VLLLPQLAASLLLLLVSMEGAEAAATSSNNGGGSNGPLQHVRTGAGAIDAAAAPALLAVESAGRTCGASRDNVVVDDAECRRENKNATVPSGSRSTLQQQIYASDDDDEVEAELCVEESRHFELLDGRIDVSYRRLQVRAVPSSAATTGYHLFRDIVTQNGEKAVVFAERERYPLYNEQDDDDWAVVLLKDDDEDRHHDTRSSSREREILEVVKLTVLQFYDEDEEGNDDQLSTRLWTSILEKKLEEVVADHLQQQQQSFGGDSDEAAGEDERQQARLEAKDEIRRQLQNQRQQKLSAESLALTKVGLDRRDTTPNTGRDPSSMTCTPYVLRKKHAKKEAGGMYAN